MKKNIIIILLLIFSISMAYLYFYKVVKPDDTKQGVLSKVSTQGYAEYIENENGIPSKKYILKTNKETAVANGNDSITIQGGNFVIASDPNMFPNASPSNPVPNCMFAYNPPPSIAQLQFQVSGSGNSLDPSDLMGIGIDCNTGYATVTLKSTVAGQKTISLGGYYAGGMALEAPPMDVYATLTVTFTAPSTTSTPTPNPQTSTNRSTPNTAPTPSPSATQDNPAVPVLVALKVGSTDVALDKVSENKITTRKKLRFNGKTVANGKLKLYFQSDPLEVETTADKDGIWSYELEAEKLGAGEHTLQVAVTDPTTNKTSEKSTPFKFNVEEAPKTEATNTETPKETILTKTQNNQYYPYILGGVFSLITILAAGTFVVIKHKKAGTSS